VSLNYAQVMPLYHYGSFLASADSDKLRAAQQHVPPGQWTNHQVGTRAVLPGSNLAQAASGQSACTRWSAVTWSRFTSREPAACALPLTG